MRYRPINKTAKEILIALGFRDDISSRGWVLKRKKIEEGNIVQIHCLIDLDGTMVTHYDVLHSGKHTSHKGDRLGSRLARFKELYIMVDNGEEVRMGEKLRRNYYFNPSIKRTHKDKGYIYK